jgi:hypothetical protein
MQRSAAESRSREPLGPYPSAGNGRSRRGTLAPPSPLARPGLWAAILAVAPPGQADGRLRPGHGPVTRWEGAPVTRRLLVVAAVAAILGLAATPALDETAVGWFGLPWDSSRGLRQPGQQGQPTAPSPTGDRQGGNVGHRSPHASTHPRGRGPKLRRPKASPTRPGGRPGRRRENCMRAHGQLAANPQLSQRQATARSASCPAVAGRRRPGHGAGGCLGSPVADAAARSSGTRSHLHSP